MVGAERPHEVGLGRAADTGDLGAVGLRELNGVGADTAGCSDDQDLLSGFDPAEAQPLEGGGRGDGNGGSLFEGEGRGLVRELVFAGRGVLGESSSAGTEDLVADREPGHLRADGGDGPSDGTSGHAVLR